MFTFQALYFAVGALFVLVGIMLRGAMVFAMRRSNYDRFSYLATWIAVSPALFVGLVLLWLGYVSSGIR